MASFLALISLLDCGTSNAFYSFISSRNRSRKFFIYYIYWLIIQFTLTTVILSFFIADEWIEKIWNGESRYRVVLAFVAVFMQQQLWAFISYTGESQRLTTPVQIINILISLFHFCIIIILFSINSLNVNNVLYFIIFEFILAALVAKKIFPIKYSEEDTDYKDIVKQYGIFCVPLIPYTLFGMISAFSDTWMLRHYGGKIEQAYYSIAAQFSIISLIAATSIIRILWKEVAEANANGDIDKINKVYKIFSRLMYIIAVIISGLLIPWTKEIILLLLGESYVDGAIVMGLMLLYPIHQVLGQVNGVIYYALEMTRPMVIMSVIFFILSPIITYFLLAPVDASIPGLGLNSVGLAIKMLVLQIIAVTLRIWWLDRNKGWNFTVYYQIVLILIFIPSGYLVYYVSNYLLNETIHILFRSGFAVIMYCLITIFVIYNFPGLLGLNRAILINFLKNPLVAVK